MEHWLLVTVAAVAAVALLLLVVLGAWLWAVSSRVEAEVSRAARAAEEADAPKSTGDTTGSRVPVNVPTRGKPIAYVLVGRLSVASTGTDQSKAQRNNLLEVWGRPTYARSYRWNYYVRLESGMRLPLEDDRGRSCEADLGCAEISDGDTVVVRELGSATYVFSRYETNAPKYIPDDV